MNVYPILKGNRLYVYRGSNSVAFEDLICEAHGYPNLYVSGNTVVLQYPNGCREEYRFNEEGLYESHEFFG